MSAESRSADAGSPTHPETQSESRMPSDAARVRSGLGTASSVIAVLTGAIWIGAVALGLYLRDSAPDARLLALYALLGISLLAGFLLHSLGLILGLAGLLQRTHVRRPALVGAALNALLLAALAWHVLGNPLSH